MQDLVETASNRTEDVCADRGKGDDSGFTTDLGKSNHLEKRLVQLLDSCSFHLNRIHRLSSGDP